MLVAELWIGACAYNATEERSKQCLRGKIVAHFLQTEQDAADWSAEGNSYSTSSTGAQNLPTLAIVVAVLGENTASNVSNACRNVYLAKVSYSIAQGIEHDLRMVLPYRDSGQMQH